MKSNLTDFTKRKFFQLETDERFRKELSDLANADGISASGVVRMLVRREHAFRFNGNGHTCPMRRSRGEMMAATRPGRPTKKKPMKKTRIIRICNICKNIIFVGQMYGKTAHGTTYCEKCE